MSEQTHLAGIVQQEGEWVKNAIAATSSARRVTVNFHSSGDRVRLSVVDEGHGVPEEVRAHLFEAGRTGRPGGSGLGLAISQLLARQIGATLALESTGPGGSTFVVTLPLSPENEASYEKLRSAAR